MLLNNFKYRVVNGVLLLDKGVGETSSAAVNKIKRLFCAKKAGHTGALDPLATGMLPICFGEATKFSKYLIDADKRYYVVAKFGERTDTSDSTGRVVAVRPVIFSADKLYQIINSFRGESLQVPSMFSAVKYQGRPLYKYAREGIKLSIPPRSINIYSIDVLYYDNDKKKISLEIHCSKGTYIRTIIDDIGEHLACGAHVVELRRLAVSRFFASSMITFSALQNIVNNKLKNLFCKFDKLDKLLLSIDTALLDMPVIKISLSDANAIRYGKTVEILTELNNCLVRIIEDSKQRFIGIGKIINQKQLVPCRLIASTIIL